MDLTEVTSLGCVASTQVRDEGTATAKTLSFVSHYALRTGLPGLSRDSGQALRGGSQHGSQPVGPFQGGCGLSRDQKSPGVSDSEEQKLSRLPLALLCAALFLFGCGLP